MNNRIRFGILASIMLAACGASVAPATELGEQPLPVTVARDGATAVVPEDAATADAAAIIEDAAGERATPPRDWGCNPCERLRECCMQAWGDACEIIDRNFSVSWCDGRYGEFVQCADGCAELDCSIVRARACNPR